MAKLYREEVLLTKSKKRQKRSKKKKRQQKHLSRFLARKNQTAKSDFIKKINSALVILPKSFDLATSPGAVVQKLAEIEKMLFYGRDVFVDMEKVEVIDYSTLACLLAVMYKFRQANIYFNGNFPKNAKAKRVVVESGFLDALYLHTNKSVYVINADNQFITHKRYEGFQKLVEDHIVPDVSSSIWGGSRRVPGLWTTLHELVYNTAIHAGSSPNEERWWLSINYDRKNKKVTFVFLDYGVGILASLSQKESLVGEAFRMIVSKVGENKEDLVMKDIIEKGGLTATRKDKHGTGIHGIKLSEERNEISKVMLVSNNVSANVTDKIYEKLETSFPGTLFYWEIEYSNLNFDTN